MSGSPESLDREAMELAALYALEALPPDEQASVEQRFRGVAPFWDEVESLRAAAAELASDLMAEAPPVPPSRDLWPELSERVRAGESSPAPPRVNGRVPGPPPSIQVWREWKDTEGAGGMTVCRSGEGEFERTAIEGIEARCLNVDEAADRITMMVRMAPGTAYPPHRHAGPEECYVLSGDLSVGADVHMEAGDFQHMEAGSIHPVQSTREGCLLLLVSSRNDELLAGARGL